jgi:hypothetical protein
MSRTDKHTPFRVVEGTLPWHKARKHFRKSAGCGYNCTHCNPRLPKAPRTTLNQQAIAYELKAE